MPISPDRELTVTFRRAFILDVPERMETAAAKTVDSKLQKGFRTCAELFRQAVSKNEIFVKIRRPMSSWRWLVGGADTAKCHALSTVLKYKLDILEAESEFAKDKKESDRRLQAAMKEFREGE